jgi:D-galactarolactone cycloisomerase
VQPYATGFYRIEGQGRRSGSPRKPSTFRGGFSMMKVKLGYGVDDDIACMRESAAPSRASPSR